MVHANNNQWVRLHEPWDWTAQMNSNLTRSMQMRSCCPIRTQRDNNCHADWNDPNQARTFLFVRSCSKLYMWLIKSTDAGNIWHKALDSERQQLYNYFPTGTKKLLPTFQDNYLYIGHQNLHSYSRMSVTCLPTCSHKIAPTFRST